MEMKCKRCSSINVHLRDSSFDFESFESKVRKKFFCVDCGYEFEVVE